MISPQVFSRKSGGAKASGRGGAARAPSASGLDDVFGFHPDEDEKEMEEDEDDEEMEEEAGSQGASQGAAAEKSGGGKKAAKAAAVGSGRDNAFAEARELARSPP